MTAEEARKLSAISRTGADIFKDIRNSASQGKNEAVCLRILNESEMCILLDMGYSVYPKYVMANFNAPCTLIKW